MRHVWGFVSALGLLVFIIFGTWGCLTAGANDPTAPTTTLIALAGAGVMVLGVVARGDGSPALTKTRAGIGAIGLVVAPVAGFLTLVALAIDPAAVPGFLFMTIVALGAWAQGLAVQVGWSIRLAATWIGVVAVVTAVAVVVWGVIAAIFIGGLAWDGRAGAALGFAAVLGLIRAVRVLWLRGRPDREAAPGAVARTVIGRPGPGDLELLAGGPGPILRPIAPDPADRLTADARLAAADARLAPVGSDTTDDASGKADVDRDGDVVG